MPTYKELRKQLEESSLATQNLTTLPKTVKVNEADGDRMLGGLLPALKDKGVLPWLGETLTAPSHALMAGIDTLLPGGKRPLMPGMPMANAFNEMKRVYMAPDEERQKFTAAQLAKDRGAPDTKLTDALGFGADAITDPMNLVAPLKLTKNLGKAIRGVERAVPALEALKLKAARGYLRPLSAYAGMRPEVAEGVRLAQSAHRTQPERLVEKLYAEKVALPNPKTGQMETLSKLERMSENELNQMVGKARAGERWDEVQKFLKKQEAGKWLEKTHPSEIVSLKDVKGLAERFQVSPRMAEEAPELAAKLAQEGEQKILRDFAENVIPQSGPINRSSAADLYSRFVQSWKKQVTVNNPRFFVNNALVGNPWQIMAAGDGSLLSNNPLTAMNTIQKGAKWTTNLPKPAMVGKYTSAEVEAALKKYGVDTGLAQHITYAPDDIQRVIQSVKDIHAPVGYNPYKIYSRAMAKINDVGEKSGKIGVVLDRLEKGDDLDKAVIAAKDALFDYQEVTPALRKLRDAGVPFLTFAMKNLPMQLKNVVNKPSQLGMVSRLQEQTEDAAKKAGTYIPENERYTSSVNNLDFSTSMKLPTGESVMARNALPLGDINLLGLLREGKQGEEAIKLLLDKAGPVPQIALDMAKSKYSRNAVPVQGMMGKVPANAGVEVALSRKYGGEKELGTKLGLDTFKNKKDPDAKEYRIPWLVNTAINNILPLTNSMGRAGLAYSEPDLATDPMALGSWLGRPLTAVKPASRKANKKSNKQKATELKRAKVREKKGIFDPGEEW